MRELVEFGPIQEIIAAYRQFVWINRINIAARALLLFDYLITIDTEVQLIWGHKLSIGTFLFLANRYLNILASILELIQQGRFNTNKSCEILTRISEVCLLMSLLAIAIFATLRVYGIWRRDWRPALPVLVFALVPFCLSSYVYHHVTPTLIPVIAGGCALQIKIPANQFWKIITLVRSCAAVYDTLAIVLTCYKTLLIRRASIQLNIQTPLVILLVRDGTIYFILLFIVSIVQLVLAPRVKAKYALPYVVSPITSIVMSRFLLSLRQVYLPDDPSDPETERTGQFTSGVFSVRVSSRLMGNIAAPVSIGASNYQEASGGSAEVCDDSLMAGLQDSSQRETSGLELNVVEHPTYPPVPGPSTIAEV